MTSGASGRPHQEDHGARLTLGAAGESLAARWYEARGYEVIERNWRRREGEVDLIVRQGSTVVFSEVKTRSTDRFGTGAESVLPAKQRRIRRLASRWLSELTPAVGRGRIELRFDVVSITAGAVEVVEEGVSEPGTGPGSARVGPGKAGLIGPSLPFGTLTGSASSGPRHPHLRVASGPPSPPPPSPPGP